MKPPFLAGDIEIDPGHRTATRNGEDLKLGDRSFDLLLVLVEAAPSVVSKQELAQKVWRAEAVTDETIAQRVSLLRRALIVSEDSTELIKTVHGRGYAFTQSVSDKAHPTNTPSVLRTRSPAILAGLGLAATIALGWAAMTSDEKADPIGLLVNPENGSVWMGVHGDIGGVYPVRAVVAERAVIINGPVELADIESSPVARSVYCALAQDRTLFTSRLANDLEVLLDAALSDCSQS